MAYINYKTFSELKDYIISIYNNKDGLCVLVKKEYFKGKKFKNIEYTKSFDDILKTVKKQLHNDNGEIIIQSFLTKKEAKNERQAKRK